MFSGLISLEVKDRPRASLNWRLRDGDASVQPSGIGPKNKETSMKFTKLCLLTLLLFPSTVFAQTQHITVSAPFYKMTQTLSDEAVTPNISQPTAEINNGAQGAEAIMNSLITKIG